MSGVKVLALALFLAVQAASQDASKMFPYPLAQDGPSSPHVRTQCRFSDGTLITVDYSTRHIKVESSAYGKEEQWRTAFNDITFVTDENLITTKKIVPAGDYTIVASPDIATLSLRRNTGGESHVSMSAAKLASPAENSAISFEHTGGSCMMHVNWKNSNTRLSVEFTEKNADLPVAN
jgi:hypothetical protein